MEKGQALNMCYYMIVCVHYFMLEISFIEITPWDESSRFRGGPHTKCEHFHTIRHTFHRHQKQNNKTKQNKQTIAVHRLLRLLNGSLC